MRILLIGSTQKEHIAELYKKKKHNIDMFAEYKNKLLRKIVNVYKIFKADIVYHVGGVDITKNKYLMLASFLNKRIVVHWIGTDVLNAQKLYEENKIVLNSKYKYISLAGSERLKQELKEIGIDSFVIPIVPLGIKFECISMPEKHAVIVYIPEEREDFYRMDIVKMVARQFPNIPFYIVANTGKYDSDNIPNMIYQGYLNKEEMYELYKKCSVLLRYP